MLLLVSACQEEGLDPTRCRDGKCTYTFEKDAALILPDSIGTPRVESGDKLVFTYQYAANDRPNIADDEYTEFIYFEIPADVSSFDYADASLASIKTVLYSICFCPLRVVRPEVGRIQGRESRDGSWEVEITLEFDRYGSIETRNIAARFEEAG
ncbi:MAG: hypothetical protein D6722_05845 [Bacteroidetes bacterium]|nr:MAG: hypothetical protein D6722_05845 [Bacteroidota bacterium]